MKLGIDLGTSYSSVAAEVNGKIEVIKLATGAGSFGDSFSMPTAVYIDDGNILLGQAAYNKRKLSPASFKSEFKRDLGTTTPYILGGEDYLPEQLYTEFFLYFKNMATEQTGEKVEKVYITHPANYGNTKKRLIEKAANNAGLFDVVLVDEPTAAAAGYAQKSRIEEGDMLLIYDLGGGTFDVALIKKTSKGYVHLTEPLGISMCGGVDFDRAIFDDIIKKLSLCGTFDMERLIKEKRFTAALSESCIQIKHQLSQADSHTEPIAVGFDYFDYTITRQEFEELIHPFLANTCEKVKDILKNSGLVASDIDRVLLVGGSSRVPLVRNMVQDTLRKSISLDADPELAVCQGAISLGLVMQDDMKDKHEGLEYMEEILGDVVLGHSGYDGEWIYYMSMEPEDQNMLYKIKKDGSQKTRLSSRRSEYKIIVDDEWVYYQTESNDDQDSVFYRIRKDGKDDTRISMGPATLGSSNEFFLNNGWIYFNKAVDNSLCKMRVDGTYVVPLGNDKNVDYAIFKDDWIYYNCYPSANNVNLCRISIDGSKRSVIHRLGTSDGSNILVAGMAVFDNWVYYRIKITEKEASGENSRFELWKIRTDGYGNSRILDNCGDMLFFNIVNGHLYYNVWRNDRLHIYRMDLNGTGAMKVSLEMLRQVIEDVKMEAFEYKDKKTDAGLISQQNEKFPFKMTAVVENHELMQRLIVNIMFGLAAYDDRWIYYLDHNSTLHKIKTDGSQMIKLSNYEAVCPVKIDSEWVYYRVKEKQGNKCNFFRIKKNGTQETEISREYSNQTDDKYAVKNGWIYFSNSSGYLTKVRTDGSSMASIGNDNNVSQVNLEDDWIYYKSTSHNFTSKSLCRISIDGTKKTVVWLYSTIDRMTVSGDWIIYNSSNYKEDGLWKVRVDGTGNSQVCAGNVDSFNIIGDRLYYEIYSYNEDHSRDCKIYRSHIDGSGLELVSF